MKIIALLGSPRVGGNTDVLLNEVIRGLTQYKTDIKKYELLKLRIKPCVACYKCGEIGNCICNDDMDKLFKEFDAADVIIFATPLYFNSVSSISKLMIDRCHGLWASKYIYKESLIDRDKKRMGIFICTAGAKQGEDGFIGAEVVADLFFRSVNTKLYKKLLVDNTDKMPVSDRSEILLNAYEIGEELYNLLK